MISSVTTPVKMLKGFKKIIMVASSAENIRLKDTIKIK